MLQFLKKKYPALVPLLGGIVLFFGGILVGRFIPSVVPFAENDDLITREGGYALINPLLSCDINEDIPYSAFASLKNNLQKTIDSEKGVGSITRASVYFRDMDLGHWTGVNEDALYAPASLIKVPLMIGYLYEARNDANILNKKIEYTGDVDETKMQAITPKHPLVPGTYSVNELLTSMIAESDNNAYSLLSQNLSTTTLGKVYSDFGVAPSVDINADSASAKTYSRFFRILYNGSFLGRVRSQTALTLLSETNFKNGIVSGVPERTLVAHKFGEKTVADTSGGVIRRELHDCGIVYYPHHPYLICVMTEGKEYADLETTIAALSKEVYTAVSKGLLQSNQSQD